MANPEHIIWLREGVGSWNRLRQEQPFTPDLSGEDVSAALAGHLPGSDPMYDVSLAGINFAGADLSRAELNRVDLTEANFMKAKLIDTTFRWSRLKNATFLECPAAKANFTLGQLRGASFVGVDLTGACFAGSDLTDATLLNCNLDEAIFLGATLTGTAYRGSEPWRAYLHESVLSPDSLEPLDNNEVNRTNDLLSCCQELRNRHGDDHVLYFRGEDHVNWDLRPSIMRSPKDGESDARFAESQMLNELMTRHPGAFGHTDSASMEWVMARQHGLRTRLLDITRNPLVALFFACAEYSDNSMSEDRDGVVHAFVVPRQLIKSYNSDTIRILSNFAKLSLKEQKILLGVDTTQPSESQDGSLEVYRGIGDFERASRELYGLIHKEAPYFKEKIDPRDLFRIWILEPQRSFERLRAQSGAFLLSAFHERFEESRILERTRGIQLYRHYKLTVAGRKKRAIRDELELLGVSRETLFRSVDESAAAITERFLRGAEGGR